MAETFIFNIEERPIVFVCLLCSAKEKTILDEGEQRFIMCFFLKTFFPLLKKKKHSHARTLCKGRRFLQFIAVLLFFLIFTVLNKEKS